MAVELDRNWAVCCPHCGNKESEKGLTWCTKNSDEPLLCLACGKTSNTWKIINIVTGESFDVTISAASFNTAIPIVETDAYVASLVTVDQEGGVAQVKSAVLNPYGAYRLMRRLQDALFEIGQKIDKDFECRGSMK